MNLKRTFAKMAAAALLLVLTVLPSGANAADPGSNSGDAGRTLIGAEANKTKAAKPAVQKNAKAQVKKVSQKDLEAAMGMIDKAVLLIKTEAREKPKAGKITNSALDGMTLLIEDKKLNADFLKQIDADATPDTASRSLKAQFLEAANKYPQLMEGQKLTMAALKGIMKSTDDPYTVYLTPDEYKNLSEQMSGGNFGGIGIVMGLSGKDTDPKESRVLIVNRVMDGGPSARAGLRHKDEIIRIDGKPIRGLDLNECSKLLRGKPGSKVLLTIMRPGSSHIFDVPLIREVIHVDSVKSEVIEREGIKVGYIMLGIFGETTNAEMEKAVRALEEKGCEAYILDVRNNAGGYVSAAVDVCSKFVKTGSRIVSIAGSGKEQVFKSSPNLRGFSKPLAVLINSNSASASEITAGAIRDLKRGTLIGVKSFGKGSVQKLYPQQFPEGKTSSFKITTAHYHTPAGHDIHKAGLKPDIEVKMEDELILEREKDTQLAEALKNVAEKAAALKADSKSKVDEDGTVSVKSFQEEIEYMDDLYRKDGGFEIVKRSVTIGDEVIDSVTVKDGSGREHSLRFRIVPGLDPEESAAVETETVPGKDKAAPNEEKTAPASVKTDNAGNKTAPSGK